MSGCFGVAGVYLGVHIMLGEVLCGRRCCAVHIVAGLFLWSHDTKMAVAILLNIFEFDFAYMTGIALNNAKDAVEYMTDLVCLQWGLIVDAQIGGFHRCRGVYD